MSETPGTADDFAEKTRNPFNAGGADYARHRPTYPPELAGFLAGLCDRPDHALDVGCGSGQLSCLLATVFARVTATDPSADQLASATACPGVTYRVGAAERIDLDDASVDLVTAAQAAHWFDHTRFYAEIRRVVRPGGGIALVSYGVPEMDGDVGARLHRFYWDEIHDHWPDERRHVENGYRSIAFPFAEQAPPDLAIVREWRLEDLAGYVGTWSAVRRATAAGAHALVGSFLDDLNKVWGAPERVRRIAWPVNVRSARL